MGQIFILLSLPLALYGCYLIVLFLKLRFSGDVRMLEITGFQRQKNKGRFLPIVSYENAGKVDLVEIKEIDQIAYILSPPIEKQVIQIAGIDGAAPCVFGYYKLVVGIVMLLPVLAALGYALENVLFMGQVTYVFIFIALLLGGFAVLKLIQRS